MQLPKSLNQSIGTFLNGKEKTNQTLLLDLFLVKIFEDISYL